jgi:hypothetical protein
MAKVRRPASEWARLMDEWRRSGLSLPAFCQRLGLNRGTMQNWVYKPSFSWRLAITVGTSASLSDISSACSSVRRGRYRSDH